MSTPQTETMSQPRLDVNQCVRSFLKFSLAFKILAGGASQQVFHARKVHKPVGRQHANVVLGIPMAETATHCRSNVKEPQADARIP